jgi:hypothetical protein
VTILTAISFLTAFIFALSTSNDEYSNNKYYNNYNNNNRNGEGSQDEENNSYDVAVTSRALAFSALWTGVLAALLSVFGTVILGWQSPTGLYYTCCSSSVHRTTPLGIGSFIGALLMFANLTLVCSVLFGEFQVSDSQLCVFPLRIVVTSLVEKLWMKCVSRIANIILCSFVSRFVATRFEIVTKGRIEGAMRIKNMGNGRLGQQRFQSCAWS